MGGGAAPRHDPERDRRGALQALCADTPVTDAPEQRRPPPGGFAHRVASAVAGEGAQLLEVGYR